MPTPAAAIFSLLERSHLPTRSEDLQQWWARHHALVKEGTRDPFALAVGAGAGAQCMGFAFASGYQAALDALARVNQISDWPCVPRALCVTEAQGNRPRHIESTVRIDASTGAWTLRGSKTFVTLGSFAQELIVVAREGEEAQGRARLRALRVPSETPGVELRGHPSAPFVPEVPHASVHFENVSGPAHMHVSGDAYLGVVKPFRTVEDIHVFAALLSWGVASLRRSGRSPACAPRVETCLALLTSLGTLAAAPNPLAPALHLALAPVLEQTVAELNAWPAAEFWPQMEPTWREGFVRDLRLCQVAAGARAQRRQRARDELTKPVA